MPDGWFALAYSDELAAGEVKTLRYFGTEIVLYRGEDGRAVALDAYCPHLGAHLGVGGKVVGNSIRCPFHAWRFDETGSCVEIPYARKIPPKARLDAWPIREMNGNIYLWRHAERKPPEYEPPLIPQWGDEAWTPDYRKFRWTVRTHPQEVMENTVDFEHFRVLHGMPSVDLRIYESDGNMFHWGVGSKGAGIELPADMPEQFKPAGESFAYCIWGQAWGVSLSPAFITTPMFEVVEHASMNPIDDETTEISIGFLLQRKALDDPSIRPMLDAYLTGHAGALDQDIPIWESK
jgi:phenylpropionate dioxygenase-like ring-hydroxylating dioxygenase large terminal subunit